VVGTTIRFFELFSGGNSEGFLGTTDLTAREVECLQWCAKGNSSAEVGKILGITERTVNWHIDNAIRKTSCVNRVQAVAKAVSLGIIEV
jgi:LuxR family transcriptional regulator, quorum-sensing system regulator BjaR1